MAVSKTVKHIPLFCLLLASASLQAAPAPMQVTSTEPARKWTEGYGTGNGRLGILSFGVFPKETIVLNEGSIFAKKDFRMKEGAAEALDKARRLCSEGKYRSADQVFQKEILVGTIAGDYQQGGLLQVEFQGLPAQTSYRRTLDMQRGKASTRVQFSTGELTTEILAAPVSDCAAYHISCTLPSGCRIALDLQHPDPSAQITARPNGWVLTGQGSNGGTRFENTVLVLAPGASVTRQGKTVILDSAKEVLVLSSTSTDYNIRKPESPLTHHLADKNTQILEKARKKGWKKLAEETEDYFSRLMMRCQVDLGDSPPQVSAMTTSQRLERVRQGETDPDLLEQLFQFGRFCTIVHTRPGQLPCGLQGLWNPEMRAAWMGCYFLNINSQMNQWPSHVTGLGEFQRPYLEFVRSLRPYGEEFARFLQRDGFCFGHYTDCWKHTYFSGNSPEFAASLMNGAWACAHLVDNYRFTGDREDLKKSLPILESSARFIMSWFEDDGQGRFLSGPGVSPETGFHAPDGTGPNVLSYVSNGTSHDQLLGREALRNYIYACRELGIHTPTLAKAAPFLRNIPQPAIGPDGRVQEWQKPFEEMQKGHRHISHLYGLFPGTEWDVLNTPQYAEAVRKSADFRRKYADMGNNGIRTGWSTAWLINLYATLGDGNAAEDRMYIMLRHYINPNLFDLHPPFQIDGNFGFTSGVAQCLIQSQIMQDGFQVILLAPALADHWKKGSATGLHTRGGLKVDLSWENGRVRATATASRPGKFRFMHQGRKKDLVMKKGETAQLDFQLLPH